LYFRLNVVGFFLPPLRDRRASVPPLLNRFLREFAERNRPDVTGFAAGALRLLQEYDWPGNVRELRNAVKRAVCLCAGPRIEVEDLTEAIQRFDAQHRGAAALAVVRAAVPNSEPAATLALSKQEVEIRRILEALQKHNNNRLRAAAELGISRVALYKKLNKYGLMTPRYQSPGKPEPG
jgi:DNA-binding NtrC family response regulator